MSSLPPLESVNRLEPIRVSRASPRWPELADLAAQVLAASKSLGAGLPREVLEALKVPCVLANTYASNRIEGHDTTPAEVQRAAERGFRIDSVPDKKRRELMAEAKGHIATQHYIEKLLYHMPKEANMYSVLAPQMLSQLHKIFFKNQRALDIRWHTDGGQPRHYSALPGKFRGWGMDVRVGPLHEPPLGVSVDEILVDLCTRYAEGTHGILDQILDIPAVHHRLLFLHPFPDGNGRIVRLLTHFQIQLAGIGSGGLWSISRGLALGLTRGGDGRGEYLREMSSADTPRRGDLDGRGNLSTSSLEDFVAWFLKIMLDQIAYMGDLYQLDELEVRLEKVAAQAVPSSAAAAGRILRGLLRSGRLTRAEAQSLGGLAERRTRTVLGELAQAGLAEVERKEVLPLFGDYLPELFPRLFPA